jgi:hypothetical protein
MPCRKIVGITCIVPSFEFFSKMFQKHMMIMIQMPVRHSLKCNTRRNRRVQPRSYMATTATKAAIIDRPQAT